jgi:long-chain acyl-CoA synthetase
LKITDRKKELFKTSGGKYIAPSPIEQRIKASRFVSQVVLIGNERNFPRRAHRAEFRAARKLRQNQTSRHKVTRRILLAPAHH